VLHEKWQLNFDNIALVSHNRLNIFQVKLTAKRSI